MPRRTFQKETTARASHLRENKGDTWLEQSVQSKCRGHRGLCVHRHAEGGYKDSLEGLYVLVTIASRNWVCVNFSSEGAPDQSILGHQKPTVLLKAV